MKIYFILLELFIYLSGVYLVLKKKELSIIYIPVLCFAHTVITGPMLPAIVFMGMISVLMLRSIKDNPNFLSINIFSVLITGYFLLLVTRSKDLGVLKENFLNVILYFLAIPLISSVYKKYSKEVILKELYTSVFLLLLIFISNVALSTVLHYNPLAMYGISSGILYGNMIYTDFNILAVSIFVIIFGAMQKRNLFYLIVCLVSLCFVAVSLRRSVMAMSVLGVFFSALIFLRHHAKQVIIFGIVGLAIGGVIAVKTDLVNTFNERYELRRLDDRDLEEEKRFIEYELLYDDMVVYKRYSPWIGFELFNSPGNYGGGIFYERSLHGDLTSIAHSSGLIGVFLYLLMVITAFCQYYRSSKSVADKLVVLFCLLAMITFTASGRYTELGSMVLIFLAANLPLAKEESSLVDKEKYQLTVEKLQVQV